MTAPLIEVRELTLKPFPGSAPFSLHINPGERWQLTAPTGSGKSALVKTMLGLISPLSGDVLLNGQNLHTLSPAKLLTARSGMGVIFSSAGLIPAWTGYDNLALPLRFQRSLSERDVAGIVNDFAFTCGLPPHWLTEPSARLSRQESALLALVRTLIIDPKLLIIDNSLVLPLLEQSGNKLADLFLRTVANGCALFLCQQTSGGADHQIVRALQVQFQLQMEFGSIQFVGTHTPENFEDTP